MNYLMLRLFARPVLAIFGSLFLYITLAYWLPQKFTASPIFAPLGAAIQENAGFVPLALFLFGTAWFVANGYRLWQWSIGEEPCCPRCGMMMEFRTGRYGTYLRCIRQNCRGKLDF